ncbi:DUF4974 domain-containing protein [Chitinophaga japonensis]|uniref:Uncharacterized protein n=1 Tax=Chitinophaga japonensis TaxID=104662 RepID=A0A562T259_CHIJA|nr:DUF4974 domain-containing protein [Chitinophaga japonensis]TWI87767.1 hypothetical protein LX66_1838 [Chitinophaga japonensis]
MKQFLRRKLDELQKYFKRKKRRAPRPWEPFDLGRYHDLLNARQHGLTSQDENDYIDREGLRNADAFTLYQDFKETLEKQGEKVFSIIDYFDRERLKVQRRRKKLALAGVLVAVCVFGAAAFNKFYKIVPREQRRTKYFALQLPLHQIADSIEHHYGMEVIFDVEEIKYFYHTYKLDSTQALAVILTDISGSSNIQFYVDAEGRLHFRKKSIMEMKLGYPRIKKQPE